MEIQSNNTCVYKLIIEEKVENKIRYLCNKFPHNEWCGILFTNYKGSFEKHDLEITCKDILLMDIGSHTFTEFDENADIISYMTDNDLLDCDEMLIHSHCDFDTFFSGTDINTLLQEGTNKNIFVSLIVNNEGKYTAAVTRHIKRKLKIKEYYCYDFFEGQSIDKEVEEREEIQEYIEYFKLDIIKPDNENNILIDNRIKEIQERKKQDAEKERERKDREFILNKDLPKTKPIHLDISSPVNNSSIVYNKETKEMKKTNKMKQEDDTEYIEQMMDELSFKENIVLSIAKRIITCSLLLPNEERIDIIKWIKNCPKLYATFFGELDAKQRNNDFLDWMDVYLDYLLNSSEDITLTSQGIGRDMQTCVLARDLQAFFYENDDNPWIDMILEILDNYVNL